MNQHAAFEIEVIHGFDPAVLRDILEINKRSFPLEWAYEDEEQYYSKMLTDARNIHLLLNYNSKRVGYLLGIPHNEALEELRNDDPGMGTNPQAYYIETVAILPEYQGKKGFSVLFKKLMEECKGKGITTVTMHARVSNGFSEKLQKKFKPIAIRHISNWPYYNSSEPTDYIEVSLPLAQTGSTHKTGFQGHKMVFGTKSTESIDHEPVKHLSRKELAKRFRHGAYLRAKEYRETDPWQIAMKEKLKELRRDAYQKAKERNRIYRNEIKANEDKKSSKKKAFRQKSLMGMVVKGSAIKKSGKETNSL
jgi:ribosomal protein S18 acetylase RimI-like enzyme